MTETYSRAEKLAGLFLFLAILGAVGGILLVGQGKGWFQKTQTYITNFPQSYNLQPGAAVKMFNTEIGTVTRLRIIRIKDENQVEVTLRVNARYSDLIRLDSVAQVESPTILGSEYLSISSGTYGYPPIESHGTIPSRIKKTVADYLEELQPEESLRNAKQFISNIAYLSEQFKSHEQKLLATITHFDELLVSVIEAKGTIGTLLMQKDFYNRLEKSLIKVENILKNSEGVSKDIKVSSARIPNLLDKVNQELDQVKYILIDLRKASGQLPVLMETTDEVARSGKEVIDAVKANPLIQWTVPKSPASESIHLEPRCTP